MREELCTERLYTEMAVQQKGKDTEGRRGRRRRFTGGSAWQSAETEVVVHEKERMKKRCARTRDCSRS